jgi:hypothetical protein
LLSRSIKDTKGVPGVARKHKTMLKRLARDEQLRSLRKLI